MNVLAPIKTIMSSDLVTVNPADKLTLVKEIFDEHNIHHIPVVRFKELVGIISKTDFLHFLRGFSPNDEDRFVNYARLRAYTAEEIMTKGLAKLDPDDRINVALEIFLVNRFHAIPVVKNDELVGILTTYDIIKALAKENVTSDQIIESRKADWDNQNLMAG
ncbi:MAG: CBS domain-containing protein [Haliscomenobacter sp.]|nr:CBS domain-containing protein [Haliscomenobacter sp.]MBK8041225.1 CBS domain-containing protein [Haliscomenobacter sp.]MBK8654592.1 CBS domain-containing protein [Haliscomenobacter sp.]MBP9076057.1 CBS domain-containing protein [Haliscomenobacter sp.]